MRNTGIVRKIDALGRIVLPKELRYNLNINPGNDFEIFVDNDDIVLKKYSKITNNDVFYLKLLKIFNENINFGIYLVVNNLVLNNNELIMTNIRKTIYERKSVKCIQSQKLSESLIIGNNNIILPIVVNSDLIATIIAYGEENMEVMENYCCIIRELIKGKIVE